MTIGHFQVSEDPYFHSGLDVYSKHPDYFQDQRQQKLEEEMKTALKKIALDKKSIEKGRNRLLELRDAIEVERQQLAIDKTEFEKKKQQHENELLKMRKEQTELEKDRDYYRDIVESFRKDLYALFPSDSIS
jgi:predicted  nucleic acid-binding Zn-ribbon protein